MANTHSTTPSNASNKATPAQLAQAKALAQAARAAKLAAHNVAKGVTPAVPQANASALPVGATPAVATPKAPRYASGAILGTQAVLPGTRAPTYRQGSMGSLAFAQARPGSGQTVAMWCAAIAALGAACTHKPIGCVRWALGHGHIALGPVSATPATPAAAPTANSKAPGK